MGICCKVCSSSQINEKTDRNQIKTYNNHTNAFLTNQLSPQDNNNNKQLQPKNSFNYNDNNNSIKNNNIFLSGTKYEEILNKDFRYFNIFWYDPNKDRDFEHFIKCFKNVEFYKAYNLYSAINFFKEQSISEWIVITPGSGGQELILNLENFDCIKSFFIFCLNAECHKTWAKNINKVGCITSSPEELCQKLIEINQKYIIPRFNYKTQDNISSYSNEISTEFTLDSHISELSSLYILAKAREKKKLSKFYLKTLSYLNSDEIIKDFEETKNEGNSPLNFGVNFFKTINNQNFFLSYLDYSKNLILLSLYFNEYPYLLNLLSFQEVKEAFEEEIPHSLAQKDLNYFSKELYDIIMNNKSILVEKEKLKKFQFAFIHIFSSTISLKNQDIIDYTYYYQIVNLFRDIDFCIKDYLLWVYGIINIKEHKFFEEYIFCLMNCEPRYLIYSSYVLQINNLSTFDEDEQIIINDTLTIKDFIVLGDNNFHDEIKAIENKIKSNSFQYLYDKQISNYLSQKKKEKGPKIVPYFYFVIIRY